MATRVLLTIDTELTWRHFVEGAGWRDNFALSYDPAGVGIPYQLRLLKACGLKACFFVDPMPALVYGIEPVARMIEPILAAGQEVQLHVHSFWSDLAEGRKSDARFELTCFDASGQKRLLETARALLIAAGAPAPTAFRAGSFAANADTLAALRAIGLRYDSSHNGAEHPQVSALPFDAALLDPTAREGIIEAPVSQIARAGGGLRPLQLCALSTQEMVAALSHAALHDHAATTIVSHSFELASRDGKRVNELVRGRFENLCRLLALNREQMPTARFEDIRAHDGRAARPLPAATIRTARRYAEQAWGDVRYEKPLVGAAMAAAAPLGLIAGIALDGL